MTVMPTDPTSASGQGVAASGRRVVVFQLDGVIIAGRVFQLFLESRVVTSWRRLLTMSAGPVLVPMRWSGRLRPAADRARARIALLGIDQTEYRRLAVEYAGDLVGEPGRVVPGALRAIARHRQAGDRVVIVTSCEQTLGRAVLEALDLGDLELVASRMSSAPGGAVHNRGERTVTELAAIGITPPWEASYCHSMADLPLLRAARHPVLVNPPAGDAPAAWAALGEAMKAVSWPGDEVPPAR